MRMFCAERLGINAASLPADSFDPSTKGMEFGRRDAISQEGFTGKRFVKGWGVLAVQLNTKTRMRSGQFVLYVCVCMIPKVLSRDMYMIMRSSIETR